MAFNPNVRWQIAHFADKSQAEDFLDHLDHVACDSRLVAVNDDEGFVVRWH